MGGKSKSTNNTTTTTNTTTNTSNVSGTAATSGDNNGVMVSGVSDSNINVTMTDHGAMERASELNELAMTSNADVSKAALEMGKDTVDSAMDFGRDALEANADVSNNAMKHVTDTHGENLQMMAGLAGNQAAQNSENLAAIKDLAAMKVDGGQVATSKQMTIMVSVIVVMLAVAFIFKGHK